MAQSTSSSNLKTRRSLRLLTAENKSISNQTNPPDSNEEENFSPNVRQAKSKALEVLNSAKETDRTELEIDFSDESQHQRQTNRTKQSRVFSRKTSKRRRNSSSEDDDSQQQRQTAHRRAKNDSLRQKSSEQTSETGNFCFRRRTANQNLQQTNSSDSVTTNQRRSARYSLKQNFDSSTPVETSTCSNPGAVPLTGDPLNLFIPPNLLQPGHSSSTASSSAQSFSGNVPSTSLNQPSVKTRHRHPKHNFIMSTESDTDPENSLNAHELFSDASFLRAANATGASSASAALFQTLSGRVQHLMNRVSGSHSMNGRLQQYIQGIQSPDPDVKLTTLNELCSLLVMSNEDTLPAYQCRALYGPLRDCLADENEANGEIVLTACRALTYLMEALPRAIMQVVEATPIFLSKLRMITSIDIAEQTLVALEMISRRNAKQILVADGIGACLAFIEFFSINSQNRALAIVANCCAHIQNKDDFQNIREHLSTLAARLQSDDKKTIEHVCTIFARLVENLSRDSAILGEILSTDLLKTLQTMVVVQPSLLNSITFTSIIHTLYIGAACCPKLAVTLLKMNIAETLVCLLTGSLENRSPTKKSITYKSATVISGNESTNLSSMYQVNPIELLPRTPQELYEIVSLIGEMLPKLPNDETLFQVDKYLRSSQSDVGHVSALWHWQDDQGQLRPYSIQDSQRIEAAWQQHEEEVQLTIQGRQYLVDLQQLQQINEETSQARFIKRVANTFSADSNEPSSPPPVLSSQSNESTSVIEKPIDARLQVLNDDFQLYKNFIQSLFTILYEVYNSSAGPAVKHRCLQSLLRMIFYSPSDLLEDILRQQSISSQIASMLASSDYKIVISALQISEILMKKLPKIFSVYFYREGVVHQIEILIGFGVCPSLQSSATNSQIQASLPVSNEPQAITNPNESKDTASNTSSSSSTTTTPRGHGSQLHAKTHSFPYRMNSSRRQQQIETNSNDSLTNRIETRSQRGRLTTGSTQHRFKTSGRSHADETIASNSEQMSAQFGRGRTQRGAGPTPIRTTTSNDNENPFMSFANMPGRGRGTPNIFAAPPIFFPSSAPTAGSMFFLSNQSSMSHSNPSISNQERTKLKEWIQNQARHFRSTYFADNSSHSNIALEIIRRLASAVEQLNAAKLDQDNYQALNDIAQIIAKGDVSAFEMVHSGLITKLYQYLTDDISTTHNRINRLKLFLNVFIQLPKSTDVLDLKEFFLKLHQQRVQQEKSSTTNILNHLISKLHGCINQLEQFPIRINDTTGRTMHHPNFHHHHHQSALRIMSSHQLKCSLVRHPLCKTLKQWNSGPVKVDPLAMVSSLEKYLLLRGVAMDDPSGTIDDEDSEVSNESDAEDIINVLAHTPSMRIEFLINEHPIPNSMPLIEAVRLFGQSSTNRTGEGESETDNDEFTMSSNSIWSRTHTIHYRQMSTASVVNNAIGGATTTASAARFRQSTSQQQKLTAAAAAAMKKNVKTTKRTAAPTIVDELWINGQCPQIKSHLKTSLNESMPSVLTINDQSLNAISLLHVLNALNLYWSDLYDENRIIFNHSTVSLTLIGQNEFVSSKLTTKVNRQLQDQVVLMMGQIPSWVQELGYKCLFLFPFESRQMIFYTYAFDRERAIQRLIDTSSLSTHAHQAHSQTQNDLVDRHATAPRIERRKVQLSRENILADMEKILDNWNSKQFLEVQYENEVGFGLGPTLEAYSLISKELQKIGLEIWRSEHSFEQNKEKDVPLHEYIDNRHGLFPSPLGRNAKTNVITKVRQKFKFLGKFMAKALMDSRIIDMSFSIVFFKWILAHEDSLSFEDLSSIDPNLYEQLKKLKNIIHVRDKILEENHKQGSSQRRQRSRSKDDDGSSMDTTPILNEDDPRLQLEGCRIEDLSLVFTLPGYPSIELKRGGKDCSVTLQNLDEYIQLVVHWTLVEGVRRQFESFRDGFNSIFAIDYLKCFYPYELHQVFCGNGSTEFWDLKVLLESTRCDHGYNLNSRAVKWLFELMVDFDIDEQRAFLQFVTGCPRLPVGGFRMLHPPLTIVRKTAENNSDNINPDSFLPSVMTCVNYLKLPDYSSKEMMKLKLTTAIRDGQYAFLLS